MKRLSFWSAGSCCTCTLMMREERDWVLHSRIRKKVTPHHRGRCRRDVVVARRSVTVKSLVADAVSCKREEEEAPGRCDRKDAAHRRFLEPVCVRMQAFPVVLWSIPRG